ncbi:hypothetical protein OV079_11180 [Nannocystis pusilla]|uniref:Uncharacterized protein n=1 Tax=Nannocystis pusilla TaxID=889268 RepID=A0A9X3IWN5_9BACT|nr:hypothetical protein [Nannocystis pusilla]MCY1006115.1 hypothetical protein [Nannocystis pusilla]
MADPDIRSQDPDASSGVPIGILLVTFSVPILIAAALEPQFRALFDELQSGLLFGLCAAGVGIAFLAVGLATPEFVRRPQEDGSLHLSTRGTTGSAVLFLCFTTALFVATLAWTGVTHASWPLVLLAVATFVGFTREAWSYFTCVELELRPGEPRPGQAVVVRWHVSSPASTSNPRAALIAEARAEQPHGRHPRIERRHVFTRHFDANGELALPAKVVPSHFGRAYAIAWRLELAADMSFGPGFSFSLPVRVRGAAPGDLPARDDALQSPTGACEPVITLRGGHHTFAPHEPITGEITWERPTAPRRAVLRLLWRVHDEHGIACRIAVARLPRVVVQGDDDPYRGARETEESGVPLAASERRRFHFLAPESLPPTSAHCSASTGASSSKSTTRPAASTSSSAPAVRLWETLAPANRRFTPARRPPSTPDRR